MDASCVACGRLDGRLTGPCRACGGIRIAAPESAAAVPMPCPVTPLRRSRVPGIEGVRLKFEGTNPTGSFKDRVMAMLVAEAVARGSRGAVVASSGNGAVAAAAACAAAGIPLLVLVPAATPAERTAPAALRDAAVVRMGDDPSVLFSVAAELADRFELADLASTFACPGSELACRAIGREIASQTAEPIRAVASAVSVGPVLVGTAHGVAESGRPAPSLIAAQAAGCAPIVRAFVTGAEQVEAWDDPVDTCAVAIADRLRGYAPEATYTLEQIRSSGGLAGAVDDAELHAMRADLARMDGLDVELSSCAAPALLRRIGGDLGGTVCVLTSHGIKDTLGAPLPAPERSLAAFAIAAGAGGSLVDEITRWQS